MEIRKAKSCLHVNYKSVLCVCACVCAPPPDRVCVRACVRSCVRACARACVCARAYQVTLSRGRSRTKEMAGWFTL